MYRQIYCIAQRTICENKRIFHTLGIISKFNSEPYNSCINSSYFQPNLNLTINKRFKSKNRSIKHNTESDSDSEDESEGEIDNYLLGKNSKVIYATVPSLRVDAIAKAGFGISRNKIDKEFYNSNIRVNGKKCLKKSATVEVEDEIDLITGRSPVNAKLLIVHRCILLSAKSNTDSISVKLVRNKSLLIEDYDDPWNGVN
ncbi:mitochondrial transcription rescue factor 1 [Calliopsis andreniformis]|uniref:mitochondrial transcription rescue factor 1 n=1 Tax=Calliopsis andreniformis TaxID=337506 RepID=UPI003FCCADE8